MKSQKPPIFATLLTFYGIAIATLFFSIQQVSAAGVAVSLTPASLTAATATDVTYHFVASADYAIGNTIAITAPAGVTIANCATGTTNADGDATPDGSGAVASQTYTYTFTAITTNADTSGINICINLSGPTGNYGISFTDAKTINTNNDYGAALVYIGNANIVTVTAQVEPALSFVIRNSADNGNTDSCALGTLSLTAVNTCSYRLKVTTNSSSGYTIQINTDGDLRRSGSGNVADNLDIDPVVENNTVTAGAEGYGIALAAGSITGGTLTLQGNFTDNDTPLPISSATNLEIANGNNNPGTTDTTNTTLVTHRASMDGDTSTGNYTQQVTYTISANF